MVKILSDGGNYEIITPYDPRFVADLKALIPYQQRVYNRDRRTWTIDAGQKQLIAQLCEKHFGTAPVFPQLQNTAAKVDVLKILYIGKTKERGDGTKSAFGWMETNLLGAWAAVFPEEVLRKYFEPSGENASAPSGNYYELLGIRGDASDDDVKTGYRRMVKQWHPDVCKDPDAHEIFIRIQRAYEVLSSKRLRARYDAGRKLEALTPRQKNQTSDDTEYRSPLKCGNILCEYTKIGSRYLIKSIFAWDDIHNEQGQTLSTSWEKDAIKPTMIWS